MLIHGSIAKRFRRTGVTHNMSHIMCTSERLRSSPPRICRPSTFHPPRGVLKPPVHDSEWTARLLPRQTARVCGLRAWRRYFQAAAGRCRGCATACLQTRRARRRRAHARDSAPSSGGASRASCAGPRQRGSRRVVAGSRSLLGARRASARRRTPRLTGVCASLLGMRLGEGECEGRRLWNCARRSKVAKFCG